MSVDAYLDGAWVRVCQASRIQVHFGKTLTGERPEACRALQSRFGPALGGGFCGTGSDHVYDADARWYALISMRDASLTTE